MKTVTIFSYDYNEWYGCYVWNKILTCPRDKAEKIVLDESIYKLYGFSELCAMDTETGGIVVNCNMKW